MISEKQKINWIEKLKPLAKKYNVAEDMVDWDAIVDSSITYQENKKKIMEVIKSFSPDIKKKMEEAHNEAEKENFEQEMTKLEEKKFKEEFDRKIEGLKNSEVVELSRYYRKYYSLVENFLGNDKINGMFVVGVGGVGKSFNLFLKLKEMKKRFEIIKGHISPLAFYRFLYEHKDGEIIVIDDVVKLIKNEDIIAILLGAVDFDNRLVVWTSSSPLTKDLPREFIFNSKVFILANEINSNDLFVRALKDRCIYYELKFTPNEILEMLYILAKANNYPIEFVDYIRELNEKNIIENLSLRLLHKLRCDGSNWKELFNEIVEIDREKSFVLNLIKSNKSVKEQVEEFNEKTGQGRTKYYYLKAKIMGRDTRGYNW